MERPLEFWNHTDSVFKSKFCPLPAVQPRTITESPSLGLRPPHAFSHFSLVKELRALPEDIGRQLAHYEGGLAFPLYSECRSLKSHLQKHERNKEQVIQKEWLTGKSGWNVLKWPEKGESRALRAAGRTEVGGLSNRPRKAWRKKRWEVIAQRKLSAHIYSTPWQFIWEHAIEGGPIQDIKAAVKEARRGGYILEFKVRLTPTRLGED